MMRRLTLLAALAISAPATAQYIDYQQLFTDHADELTTRSLENGQTVTDLRIDDIVITRDADGNFISYATDGWAPGCTMEILIALKMLATACPTQFGPDRLGSIDRMIDGFSTYIARNAYPPRARSEVLSHVETRAQQLQTDWETSTSCSAEGDMQDWISMADNMSRQEYLGAIDGLPDRLPVSNPCL